MLHDVKAHSCATDACPGAHGAPLNNSALVLLEGGGVVHCSGCTAPALVHLQIAAVVSLWIRFCRRLRQLPRPGGMCVDVAYRGVVSAALGPM